MVIVSWNVQKCIGVDFRRDVARVARVLAEQRADVIGLQEIVRIEGMDQAATIAHALDMKLAWGPARTVRGGTFGNALLVRGDVLAHRVHDVSVRTQEKRACLEVEARVHGHALHVFVCHFGLGFREREHQATRLREIVRACPRDAPRIVLGDFNEWQRRGPVDRALSAEFPRLPARVPTHPSPLPLFALDRIAWDAPLDGRVAVCAVASASDHRAIRASLA
jgi:endonuclease/exonuclease/phosphatase family metal-dependent hydrolase